ncbi:hypothetical protein P5673_005439 [Acropora cervicornis]|uniref:Uncharacterized protein n=1 Tax=Acropora cervicornis TaxID=6130 RepID=A0AAD9VD41_ACRCE|nr:hypothetical protein P5673_005439 [Acropora cervicornis]
MLAGKAAICIGEMQVNLDNLYVCGTLHLRMSVLEGFQNAVFLLELPNFQRQQMSLWKTVLLFLTFVCMLEESAGKSSSIMETSSSPQTSILLQTEPTSSSMSVVKTVHLGISSTEYRETTSPATVYYSPSNWLVTTPSSTAESNTVTPMLAPSIAIGKDKTSLHPSNTMLIKKSTSTDMRLESTDYKLSGQITSSYKTESQQTTAIPEILSPGIKDTSSALPLNSELVHSLVSVLSLQLTTAAENRSTTPWVQVPEMISYSKATKSLKLSTSSKSSPSFPTSSPSVLSSSLLSLPTSFLLSHRGTTETTLLTKSTHSSMTPARISSNAEQGAMTNSTVVTPNSRTERPTSSDLPRMKSNLPVSTVVSSTPISPSTRRKLQIKVTLSISTSRSQVSSSLSSTSSKSSPSFPTSSLSVPLSSLLSLPTSSLLSNRETTETTLLTKSTYSSMTPVRISSNAEQAAMTNSTFVTPTLRTERPTSSDSGMTSSSTNKIPRDSTPPKNAEAQSEGKGFIIVVVLPFLVLFLLFILTFAVLIYYVCKG